MKADASSLDYFSDGVNNTAAIMGQINNVSNIRTYANTDFGTNMQYAFWGAFELKSSFNAYRNISDSVTIVESNATDLAGIPSHRVFFTEGSNSKRLKFGQLRR
jgi:hypothetical protein